MVASGCWWLYDAVAHTPTAMSDAMLPYFQARANAIKLMTECQQLNRNNDLPSELFIALTSVVNALQYQIDQIQDKATDIDYITARMAEQWSLVNRGHGWWLIEPRLDYKRPTSYYVGEKTVAQMIQDKLITTSMPYNSIVATLAPNDSE